MSTVDQDLQIWSGRLAGACVLSLLPKPKVLGTLFVPFHVGQGAETIAGKVRQLAPTRAHTPHHLRERMGRFQLLARIC